MKSLIVLAAVVFSAKCGPDGKRISEGKFGTLNNSNGNSQGQEYGYNGYNGNDDKVGRFDKIDSSYSNGFNGNSKKQEIDETPIADTPIAGYNGKSNTNGNEEKIDMEDQEFSKVNAPVAEKDNQMSTVAGDIRFLSYAIHFRSWLVSNVGNTFEGDYRKERMQDVLTKITPNQDIIAFQEYHRTLRPFYPSKVESQLKSQGYFIAYGPTVNISRFQLMDSGLATISRYPITNVKRMGFKSANNPDHLAHKGVLYTEIDVLGKGKVHVFNTFMQASYDEELKMESPSVKARSNQMREARDFIKEVLVKVPSDELVLFTGYFGTYATKDGKYKEGQVFEEYQEMLKILNANESGNGLEFIDLFVKESGHESTFKSFNDITDKEEGDHKFKGKEYRLNYLFEVKRGEATNVEVKDLELKDFEVQGKPYKRISNHDGLSAILK